MGTPQGGQAVGQTLETIPDDKRRKEEKEKGNQTIHRSSLHLIYLTPP